jgi:cellulose synthase operon protein YhjQ
MPLICFASPAGGVGRTTLAANVARELARAGERVIAMDLDPQNALGTHFGLDLRDAFGFLATLRYAADPRAAWRAALRSSPSGVSFLPFGHVGLDGAVAVASAMAERPDMLAVAARDMLSVTGVIVVVDLPAGASAQLAAILPYADLLAVPLQPDPASVAQLPCIEAGRFAGTFPPTRTAFVLNRWAGPGRLSATIGEGMRRHLGERLLAGVRHDDAVPEAAAAQRLVADMAPSSAAAQDLTNLAAIVLQRLRNVRPLAANVLPALSSLADTRPMSRPTVAQDAYR